MVSVGTTKSAAEKGRTLPTKANRAPHNRCSRSPPDTNVVLAKGTTVPISSVKIGEKVKAVDTATGATVTRAVTAVWIHQDTDLMDVTVTNSTGAASTIHATQHHPFWDLTTHTWVDADNLQPGDQLRTDNGTTTTFTSAVIVPGAADMWDLTIEGVHDFYITSGDSGILVHNMTCPTNPRDVHAAISQIDKGLSDEDVAAVRQNGASYVQRGATESDEERSINALDLGDGTSNVLVRSFDNMEGRITAFDTKNSYVLDRLTDGRWFDPSD
jgi:hypothetical protein